MLDYLISLGNQDSTQDAEESVSTEDEFDFDNDYSEYLNEADDGFDEDDADE